MSQKYSAAGRPYLDIEILAASIPYDPSASGLSATDVQTAIDEVALNYEFNPLRIGVGADYGEFTHDGTNLLLTAVNTPAFHIDGFNGVDINGPATGGIFVGALAPATAIANPAELYAFHDDGDRYIAIGSDPVTLSATGGHYLYFASSASSMVLAGDHGTYVTFSLTTAGADRLVTFASRALFTSAASASVPPVRIGTVADSFSAGASTLLGIAAAGAAILAVRDETNNIEAFVGAGTTRVSIGAVTNHDLGIFANNTQFLTLTNDGRLYGSALHNNAGAVTGTTNQYVASGTYTPTLTNTTNVASSSANLSRWIRVGNVVTVWGRAQITATAASSVIALGVSLPIASDIAAIAGLSGVGARQDGASNMVITIGGDATNNRATIVFFPENTSAYDYNFTFGYTVL